MPEVPGKGQAADDDTSWVTVSTKGCRRRGRRTADVAMTFHDSPVARADEQPATMVPSPSSASHAHIAEEHARVATRWREQPSYSSLVDLILARAPDHAPVNRAVCLGAGSFGGPLDFGESIRRAHVQTEAFLSIVELLSKHSGQSIECFFQEPLYSDADKAFLNGLGHSVIEPPAASRMITTTTLVFAIHLPTREYLSCLDGAMPAMLIGTAYGVYEDLPRFSGDGISDPLAGLRHVHLTHDELKFPREKSDHCFSDTSIYWQPCDITG